MKQNKHAKRTQIGTIKVPAKLITLMTTLLFFSSALFKCPTNLKEACSSLAYCANRTSLEEYIFVVRQSAPIFTPFPRKYLCSVLRRIRHESQFISRIRSYVLLFAYAIGHYAESSEHNTLTYRALNGHSVPWKWDRPGNSSRGFSYDLFL